MSWVRIHPGYRQYFQERGLVSAGDFLGLPGIILGGHPDRHVMHLDLKHGAEHFGAYLKKEHRVSWKVRLTNFLAGFGLVSRSEREARQLQFLHQAGVGCPEVLAVGEDGNQAFLLLREISEACELRAFLARHDEPRERKQLARELGQTLAQIHIAGFDHPDLFAKHILVKEGEKNRFYFLDWQRSHPARLLSYWQRLQNLAILDATLADPLASEKDRLACLRSYLREYRNNEDRRKMARAIRHLSQRLQKRHRVHEQRQPPLPGGKQNLIWLDGEKLCVTRQFREEFGSSLPDWLNLSRKVLNPTRPTEKIQVPLEENRNLKLVCRWASRPWRWLGSLCRRRPLTSPEFEQAATIFRLERHGITPPRLLAVGQDFSRPWRSVSFLLTEPSSTATPLFSFLQTAPRAERWLILRQAGNLLRRLHQVGYRNLTWEGWAVQKDKSGLQVILTSVDGLERGKSRQVEELSVAWKSRPAWCSRSDLLRFCLGYQDQLRLNMADRQLVGKILKIHWRPPIHQERRVSV